MEEHGWHVQFDVHCPLANSNDGENGLCDKNNK